MLDLLHIAQRVVAQDQMQPRLQIALLRHDKLEAGRRIRVLTHPDKQYPNVVRYLQPQLLLIARHLVQRHPVHLDRLRVQPELEVNVAHVDLQPVNVREHLVLRHQRVRVQRLDVHLVLRVHVGQIEQHEKRQIEVVRVGATVLVPHPQQRPVERGRLLRLRQAGRHVRLAARAGHDRFLQQGVDLCLQILVPLFGRFLLPVFHHHDLLRRLVERVEQFGVVRRVADRPDRGGGPCHCGGRFGRTELVPVPEELGRGSLLAVAGRADRILERLIFFRVVVEQFIANSTKAAVNVVIKIRAHC